MHWSVLFCQAWAPPPAEFEFKPLVWRYTTETRVSAKAKARTAFEHALKEHFDEVGKEARGKGFVKTPEKRNPDHYR